MRFNEAMTQGIKDPALSAYTAQIKAVEQKMRNATDPQQKRDLQKQIQALRQELEAKRRDQQKRLANLQKDIAQTQDVT